MRPVTVAEVVAALRSGEYQQTSGCLYDGSAYCCLGVAEAIAGAEWMALNDSAGHYQDDYGSTAMTSDGARHDLGEWGEFLDARAPGAGTACVAHVLADLNDNGKTFDVIADEIEAIRERL